MMLADIVSAVYFLFLIIGAAAAVACWRWQSKADQWVSGLLLLTLVAEAIGFYSARIAHKPTAVYLFYSPVQFVMICLYFNEAIPVLKKLRLGFFLAAAGLLLYGFTIKNLTAGENSVFMLFEAFCVNAVCMFAIYLLVRDEDEVPLSRKVHFWIASLLLAYWSFTFIHWGVYQIFMLNEIKDLRWVIYLKWIINMMIYPGFALIFLRYRKLIPSGE